MDQSEIDAILNDMGDSDENNENEKNVEETPTPNENENIDEENAQVEDEVIEDSSDEVEHSDEILEDVDEDLVETQIMKDNIKEEVDEEDLEKETKSPEEHLENLSLEDIKVKIIGALTSLTDLKKILVDLDILNKISQLSEALTKGEVNKDIDVKVKGALGNLVENLRQTMLKLQQLDSSVKEESSKVPALAEQLDAITKDTEKATQTMLTKIDEVLANSDTATSGISNLEATLTEIIEEKTENNQMVSGLIEMLENGASNEQLAGSALEYVMYLKETDFHNRNVKLLQEMKNSLEKVKESQTILQNDAFDIMNELQFQDITRQKIEKVIQLLKDLQLGLKHLLEIFHMDVDEDFSIINDDKIVHTTQNNIFSVKTDADYKKEDVDDIINSFKQNSEDENK